MRNQYQDKLERLKVIQYLLIHDVKLESGPVCTGTNITYPLRINMHYIPPESAVTFE